MSDGPFDPSMLSQPARLGLTALVNLGPGRATHGDLCELTGLSRHQVSAAMRELAARGALQGVRS